MERWKRRKRLAAGALAGLLLMGAAGCRSGIPIMSKNKGENNYTEGQIMLVAVNEKNSYESALTGDIWGVKINDKGERDAGGKSYDEFLVDQIKVFMEEMKTMNLLAQERGITLTNQELSKVNEAARAYYDSLSSGDLEYTKAKLSDIETFYQEYCLANKLVNVLTADSMVEVSDSDAKVIVIQQIRLEDEAAAAEAHAKVMEEGANFELIGRQYSQEPVEKRKIGRGEESAEFEAAAFSLEQDQISDVISIDGSYYILRCVNAYDQEATDARKAQMTLDQKDRLFRQVYNSFASEHAVTFSDEIWTKLDLSGESGSTTTGLFHVYRQYFPD